MFSLVTKENIIVSRAAEPRLDYRGIWINEDNARPKYDEITQFVRASVDVSFKERKVVYNYTVAERPNVPERLVTHLTEIIEANFITAMGYIKEGYPDDEIKTWGQQEKEANAFLADSAAASTPMLNAMAAETGLDKLALSQDIKAKAGAYSTLAGKFLGRKKALTTLVESSSDNKEGLQLIRLNEVNEGWTP